MVATSKATEQWSRRCWEVTSAKGERKTVDHAGVRCGKIGKIWGKIRKFYKKTCEINRRGPKPTQEAPRETPGGPKRAQSLPKAPPRHPKPSQKDPQIETKIDKTRWKIDPGGPQGPQELPRSLQDRFLIDFLSIFDRFWYQIWDQNQWKRVSKNY